MIFESVFSAAFEIVDGSGTNSRRPTRSDCFHSSIEPHPFGSVDVVVSKKGTFPASKTMECEGDRYGYIYPNHPNLDSVREIPGDVTVSGKNCGTVSVFMDIHE